MILQANGLDERFNQTLQNMIVKFVQDKKEIWDEYLDTCVYAYNTSVHESTNFSPFEVMFGRKAILPIDINIDEKEPDMMLMNQEEPAIAEVVDVMSEQRLKILESVKQSIQQAQIKQKHAYDKKHASKHSFEVGEMVIKKDFRRGKRAGGKLDTPFVGPYIIIKCHGKGMYCLQLASNAAEIVERVSGAYLKPYQKPKEDGMEKNMEEEEKADEHNEQPLNDDYENVDFEVLSKQINCSHLLRLWRSGARALHYKGDEDGDEFDVSDYFTYKSMHMLRFYFSILQDISLHLEQREYALSKDIDVALWIDYRLYYGEVPLREVYGGDFVIVTEDLNDEFDVFKRKVFSYPDDALRMVRSIDLLNIWIRESNVSVKSLQVLENTYYLMSPLNLDDYCQWVLDARKFFTDKSVNKNTLQCFREQLLDQTSTASCLKILKGEEMENISYLPVCSDWQEERCHTLGIKLVVGKHSHHSDPSSMKVSQAPAVTERVKGDGNCFFRSIALAVTGSQQDHQEFRLLITSYMIHNASSPKLACFLARNESVEQYMKRTNMQSLGTWATEFEIIAAASLLRTAIYVFALSGATYKWLKHSPIEVTTNDRHQNESIYITNISNHFETVKKL